MKTFFQKQLDLNLGFKLSEKEVFLLKACLFWTFVWGFAAHGFAYANFLFNHDGLMVYSSEMYMLTLGRFGHALYFFLRGTVNVPWLCGILSTLYLALSVFLVVNIFNIDNKYDICICSGILTTNTAIIVINATYFYFCDVYALSILLASLSFFIIVKGQYIKNILFASVLLMLAMGLHQISLAVWLVFAVIFTLRQNILEEYKIKAGVKNEILSNHFDFIVFLGVIILACVFYKISSLISLKITHQEYYKAFNYVENAVDFKTVDIMKLLKKTYKSFFHIFLYCPNYYGGAINISLSNISKYFIAFILTNAVVSIIYYLIRNIRNYKIYNSLYSVLCFMLFPLVVNCIYFLSKGNTNYEIVWYPHWCALFLLPTVFISFNGSVVKKAVRFSFLIIIFVNLVIANNVYEKRKIVYDSTVSALNRMLAQIEFCEDYVPGNTEVIFSGTLDKNSYFKNETLDSVFPLVDKGRNMTAQNIDVAVTFSGTYYNFIRFCMNSNINFYPFTQEYADFPERYSDVINAMPVFPAKGCCQMIDGKMVVKLSEVDIPNYAKELSLPDYSIIDGEVNFCIDNETHSDSSTYLRGWAYHDNDICRVMVSDGEHYWETNLEARPDVQKAFNLNNDKQGFSATIPAKLDGYSLYLVNDEKKEIYKITER